MGNTTKLFGQNGSSFATAQTVYGHNGSGWVAAQKVYGHNGSGWHLRYGPLTVSSLTHVSHANSGASGSGSDSGTGSISVSGGSGSYSYSWAYLSGDGSIICSNAALQSPSFSRNFSGVADGATASISGSWRCTVSDTQSGATITGDISIALQWTNTSSAPPSFTPFTSTYDSGSGNETVSTNASQLVLYVVGPGSNGGSGHNGGDLEQYGGGGAGGGGTAVKTISISAGHWGQAISWSVGAANAGTSTASGLSGSISMTANHGSSGGSASSGGPGIGAGGGSASGGDSNTTGSSGGNGDTFGTAGSGGASSYGGGIGTGGDGGSPFSGGAGGSNGRVQFVWT